MDYTEALAFWYGRTNYEVRSAGPGDLKLERMRALLRLVGDPHDRVPLVHVIEDCLRCHGRILTASRPRW